MAWTGHGTWTARNSRYRDEFDFVTLHGHSFIQYMNVGQDLTVTKMRKN